MAHLPNDHAHAPHPRRPRSLVRVAASLSLVLVVACEDAEGPPARPAQNVLLVTLDTTRPDHLGCYGSATARTPALDALAEDGVRFDRAVSTAGLTPMAHASILTGRNPYAHGLRVFYGELSHRLLPGVPSLPQLLAERGWRTAAFVSAYPVSQVFGLDRGYQTFSSSVDDRLEGLDPSQKQRPGAFWVDARANESQRRSDATTDAALTWLEEYGDQGPWHLWVHYFDVHDYSLVPPVEFARERGVEYTPEVPPTSIEARDLMYDFEMEYMDAQLGRLIEWLEQTGALEETLVLVVGDHGQGLSDGFERHGWPSHRLLYDWSIRVPLIARIPPNLRARYAAAEPGRVVPEQVRVTDLLPTILELCDLPAPEGIEGRSLMTLLRRELDEPRIAYADALNLEEAYVRIEALPPKQRDDLYAVTDGHWKWILHRTHPEESELYDLDADPEELHNVLTEEPAIVARFERFLAENDALRLEPESATESAPAPDAGVLGGLGYAGEDPPEGD